MALHQGPHPVFLHADCLWRNLTVITNHQHLARTHQDRQNRQVRLRRLVNDNQIEAARMSRKGLRDPVMRHDPARDRAVGFVCRVARVLPVAHRPLAGPPTDALYRVHITLQGRPDAWRDALGKREPGTANDQLFVLMRKIAFNRHAHFVEFFRFGLRVDHRNVRREPPQTPVTHEGLREQIHFPVFVRRRKQRRQLYATGAKYPSCDVFDRLQWLGQRCEALELFHQLTPAADKRGFIEHGFAKTVRNECTHRLDQPAAATFEHVPHTIDKARHLAQPAPREVVLEGIGKRVHRASIFNEGRCTGPTGKHFRGLRCDLLPLVEHAADVFVKRKLRTYRQTTLGLDRKNRPEPGFRRQRIPAREQFAALALQSQILADMLPVARFRWRQTVDLYRPDQFAGIGLAEGGKRERAPALRKVLQCEQKIRIR